MADVFRVVEVGPDWVLESEQMGSKEKFWFRNPADPEHRDYLFKFPTPGTGQHWAEKIAYELANEFGVVAPPVDLAVFNGTPGSTTRSFTKVKTGTTFARYELYHGNQILAGMDAAYDPSKWWKQQMHSVQRIFQSLEIFKDAQFVKTCRYKMAEYLVFDAVIGNVDRHHENWGILRKRVDDHWRGRLAPTFDHAASLGRELSDEGGKQSRKRYLEDLGIAKYLERAHGPIFVDETSKRGPSPLGLVRWCLEQSEFEPYFAEALSKLEDWDIERIEEIVSQVPPDWMTLQGTGLILRKSLIFGDEADGFVEFSLAAGDECGGREVRGGLSPQCYDGASQ